jgi:hypothetical protein
MSVDEEICQEYGHLYVPSFRPEDGRIWYVCEDCDDTYPEDD